MQVNSTNAVAVAMMFDILSADERFSMRTVSAILKSAIVPIDGTPMAQPIEEVRPIIADLAAQMALPIRRRIRDSAMLIERPCTMQEARDIANKAKAIVLEGAEPFEVDFSAGLIDAEVDEEQDNDDPLAPVDC